jgi:hypothetical protein
MAPVRAFLIVLLALATSAGTARGARLVVERLGATSQGFLYVDYRLDEPLAGRALEAIRSGLPSTLTFTIEVWRQRTGWWDRLEETRESQVRVLRDLLNEQYVLASRDEVLRFATLDSLAAALGRVRREYLRPVALDKTYYVTLGANLAPLSVQDLNELEEWLQSTLRGEAADRPGGVSGLSGTLVGLLLGMTGFGDETVRQRTASFVPEAVQRAAQAEPRSPGVPPGRPDSAASPGVRR